MEIDTSLLACPECNNVFQYYDFLSHSTTCNRNTNENSERDLATDSESETETEMDLDSNYQSLSLYNTTYNGINDYGNYINLYNPMINRNLQNHDLSNAMSTININSGLNKKDLEKYTKIIQCYERTDCAICLVSYPENTNFYLMKCNHAFCIECCEKWYSTNSLCPLCRSHITC